MTVNYHKNTVIHRTHIHVHRHAHSHTCTLTRDGDNGSYNSVASLSDKAVGMTETSEHQLYQVRGQVGLKFPATLLHHLLQCSTWTHMSGNTLALQGTHRESWAHKTL